MSDPAGHDIIRDMLALDALDALPPASAGGRRMPQRTSNRVAALFLGLPPAEVRAALLALRFSKHEVAWSVALAERWRGVGVEIGAGLAAGAPDDATVRQWLSALGRLHAGAFLRVAGARWAARRAAGEDAPGAADVRRLYRRMRGSLFRDPLDVADLAIGGDELRAAGIPPGAIYAKILHALLGQVLDVPARNTPEALLAEVPRIVAALPDPVPTRTPHKPEP